MYLKIHTCVEKSQLNLSGLIYVIQINILFDFYLLFSSFRFFFFVEKRGGNMREKRGAGLILINSILTNLLYVSPIVYEIRIAHIEIYEETFFHLEDFFILSKTRGGNVYIFRTFQSILHIPSSLSSLFSPLYSVTMPPP